jgi:hypothetical protein
MIHAAHPSSGQCGIVLTGATRRTSALTMRSRLIVMADDIALPQSLAQNMPGHHDVMSSSKFISSTS